MSRLHLIALWLCMSGGLLAAEPEAAATANVAAKARESFAGTWEITAVQPAGATKNARRLVFHVDGTYAAQDSDGKELWAGTYEIDPTKTPRVWDHRSHDSKKEGRDVLGIYELDGDKLKVACVVGQWDVGQGKEKAWTGKKRPTQFQPSEADVIIELQKVQPNR